MNTVSENLEKYEAVLELLQSAHAFVTDRIIPALTGLLTSPVAWALPAFIRDPFVNGVSLVLKVIVEIERQVFMHILSALLPIRLWTNADQWTQVRAEVTAVAGDLHEVARPVQDEWGGAAADAYKRLVPSHAAAASHLGQAAGAVSYALDWAAMSAALFYSGLAGVVVAIAAAITSGLLAAGTVVFAGMTVAGWAVVIPLLAAQVATLVAVLQENYGRVTTFMNNMVSILGDRSAFPNGQWPRAYPERYSDASVADGDGSDWSVTR